MSSTFAYSPPELQQKLFSDVHFALRNSTFLDQDKVTHKLQVILYLAGCKIMVGLKFVNGEVEIDWSNLELFWPDKAYET